MLTNTNTKNRVSFLLVATIALASRTTAHSHVECTKRVGSECQGYPRYYSFSKSGFEGTPESRDRNYVQADPRKWQCPNVGGPEYSEQYPAAKVSAGEQVTIQWPPRGHTSQKSSPVWLYCSSTPGAKSLVLDAPGTEDAPAQVNGADLVATLPYDNCAKFADSAKEAQYGLSWAECTGSFAIPAQWQAGQTYSCQWAWILNGAQTYVDCFDYEVVGAGVTPSAPPALQNQSSIVPEVSAAAAPQQPSEMPIEIPLSDSVSPPVLAEIKRMLLALVDLLSGSEPATSASTSGEGANASSALAEEDLAAELEAEATEGVPMEQGEEEAPLRKRAFRFRASKFARFAANS